MTTTTKPALRKDFKRDAYLTQHPAPPDEYQNWELPAPTKADVRAAERRGNKIIKAMGYHAGAQKAIEAAKKVKGRWVR